MVNLWNTVTPISYLNKVFTSSTTIVTAAHCATSPSQFKVAGNYTIVDNGVNGDNVDGKLTMIMFQVVVGDHDVTRGDGEQRASIFYHILFWRFDRAFIDFHRNNHYFIF